MDSVRVSNSRWLLGRFESSAKIEMEHVPFKGSAEPLNELIAGRMDVIFTTLTGVYGQVTLEQIHERATKLAAEFGFHPDACDPGAGNQNSQTRRWRSTSPAPAHSSAARVR